MALSIDHSAKCESERERIASVGGNVVYDGEVHSPATPPLCFGTCYEHCVLGLELTPLNSVPLRHTNIVVLMTLGNAQWRGKHAMNTEIFTAPRRSGVFKKLGKPARSGG